MKWSVSLCKLLIFLLNLRISVRAILVCKTFQDYYNPTDENCFDNPDAESNITEIIQRWGYNAEEYYLTTEDGYHLLLEHCFHKVYRKTPVLLAHGISTNGVSFTVAGNKSLAHSLATSGYDVWIINFRGTKYSRGHDNLKDTSPVYWDFSLDELGRYDLKAAIDFIYNKTYKKMVYIGYSMGTQVVPIYSNYHHKDLKEKIVSVALVAPALNNDSISLFTSSLPLAPYIQPINDYIFSGQLLEIIPMLSRFCTVSIRLLFWCQSFLGSVYGFDYEQLDPLTLPISMMQGADTIGSKILKHENHIFSTNELHYYDYGPDENMKRYGTLNPPMYDLRTMTVPVSIWVGLNDYISRKLGAETFLKRLPVESRCRLNVIGYERWNHIDFLYAKDLEELFTRRFLVGLEKLQDGVC